MNPAAMVATRYIGKARQRSRVLTPQEIRLYLHTIYQSNIRRQYARVSTSNGHQDPEMQLAELREYASRRGWEIVGEYTDQGVSGSRVSRPELNRLMTDAHRRRFDAVLVLKIDRFGRSLKHLVNALADLGAYGVAFISLRDNLDLSTPSMFAERTCASIPFAHSMWRRWSR